VWQTRQAMLRREARSDIDESNWLVGRTVLKSETSARLQTGRSAPRRRASSTQPAVCPREALAAPEQSRMHPKQGQQMPPI